jgi:hypothetical protein
MSCMRASCSRSFATYGVPGTSSQPVWDAFNMVRHGEILRPITPQTTPTTSTTTTTTTTTFALCAVTAVTTTTTISAFVAP